MLSLLLLLLLLLLLKVHATIPKGIVGGFELTVLQKKWKNHGTRGHGCMFASATDKQQT